MNRKTRRKEKLRETRLEKKDMIEGLVNLCKIVSHIKDCGFLSFFAMWLHMAFFCKKKELIVNQLFFALSSECDACFLYTLILI